MQPEPALLFWPRLAWETIRKTGAILARLAWLTREAIKAARDPNRYAYMDQALTPVHDDEPPPFSTTGGTRSPRASTSAWNTDLCVFDMSKETDSSPDAAAMPVRGMLKHYWDEFEYHVANKRCLVGGHAGAAAVSETVAA